MSLLETTRQAGEDLEQLKHLASAALQSRARPATPHPLLQEQPLSSSLDAEHLTSYLLTRAHETAQAIDAALQQQSGAREARTTAQSSFYTALRRIREAHREGAGAAKPSTGAASRTSALLAGFAPATFSGEEAGGTCLDLLRHHRAFINVRHAPRHDLVAYIRSLSSLSSVPAAVRSAPAYIPYLSDLVDYLHDFASRAYPLEIGMVHEARANMRTTLQSRIRQHADDWAGAEALLETRGPTWVRDELLTLGLKCGGRPIERAERLVKAGRDMHIGKRAVLEGEASWLLDALCEELRATLANVERRLAQSFEEVVADRAVVLGGVEGDRTGRGDGVGDDEADDEETAVYNPKDIPLGWDGKPMPYWMYKLHGLHHVFRCEICGGARYRGPRAFERHFSDSVHVAGLRRLGIGYSRAFLMITGIDDALRLHRKMQAQVNGGVGGTADEDDGAEFEDAHGNVLNERTFRDLSRQGLI